MLLVEVESNDEPEELFPQLLTEELNVEPPKKPQLAILNHVQQIVLFPIGVHGPLVIGHVQVEAKPGPDKSPLNHNMKAKNAPTPKKFKDVMTYHALLTAFWENSLNGPFVIKLVEEALASEPEP